MKGTILLSLILGVLFAVLTLIVGLMLWPSYAVVSAVLAFVLATPMMHFALAISERRTNKMYAELEKQITSPIFFKANGNFNLGYGVVNGNIYLCDNGIVFASVDSKPHRMQEIPAEQIWYFEFDPIHVLLHTRDGWVYEITLPNAQEVQKALEGKYGL